jgi:hypothetical protein
VRDSLHSGIISLSWGPMVFTFADFLDFGLSFSDKTENARIGMYVDLDGPGTQHK